MKASERYTAAVEKGRQARAEREQPKAIFESVTGMRVVGLLVTPEEYALYAAKAVQQGMSLPEFVRAKLDEPDTR